MFRNIATLLLLSAPAWTADVDFNGRWDITVQDAPHGRAWWLEVENAGTPQIKGKFVGFPGGEPIGCNEILEQDCEILLPAATESVINSRNASRIKARILTEGANSPTTPPADDILFDRGVFVIPDILANAGGVTVSYFEWVQDREGYFWPETLVNDRLKHIMVSAFDAVVSYGEKHKVNNRIAAYMLAIDRVAFSIKLRGIYA